MLFSQTRSTNFNILIALQTGLQQLFDELKRKSIKTQVGLRFYQLVKTANTYLYRLISFRASEDETLNLIKQTIKALTIALHRLASVFTDLRVSITNILDRLFNLLPKGEVVQLELMDESEYIDNDFRLNIFPSFLEFLTSSLSSDNYFRELLAIPQIKAFSFPLSLRFT